MANTQALKSAQDLAAANKAHFPNESPAYRKARNELLADEIELRRAIERVAARRRTLPNGGEIPKDFEFAGEKSPVHLSELFGDKDTLLVYSMMYGPNRKGPCPMCTSFINSWNGAAINLRQRVAVVVTARSPIERIVEYKSQRGYTNLPFVSDSSGEYTRAYVNADDADVPGFAVFTKRDGKIHHFYSGEMSSEMADPGQDPRGAPDADPLWMMLDTTPEGRGAKWYPEIVPPAK